MKITLKRKEMLIELKIEERFINAHLGSGGNGFEGDFSDVGEGRGHEELDW